MFIDAPTDTITVHPFSRTADPDLVAAIAAHPVALIGDVVARMGLMSSAIALRTSHRGLHGTVLPVHTREGDNLAIHRALDEARPGDVLVVNAAEETNRAVFGDILGEACLARGITGVIVDGAIRDVDELDRLHLPVYSRAISPAGPAKAGPGTVGLPIACGGIVCHPGDAVFGDRDGIITLRPDTLAAVTEGLIHQQAAEEAMRDRIRRTDSAPALD